MNLPRIAFVSASAGVQAGGAEAYTFATARGLRAMGVPVTLLHGQGVSCPCHEIGAGHFTGRILGRAGMTNTLLRRVGLFKATRTSPYDLEAISRELFSPHPWSVLRDFDVVEVQYAIETLLLRHAGASTLKILHLHGPSMPSWLPRMCRLWGAEPDLVVTCSEWSRRELRKRNIPWPVAVNYNGIDAQLFSPRGCGDQTNVAVPTENRPFRVGFTGRLSAAKGLDTIAETAARLGPGFEFHIAGPLEGDYRLPTASNIFYSGVLQSPQIVDFLRRMDCFYFPSLRESFGIAAVEAMSVGLPVIASDVGGLPEIIRSGVNGILIPVGDSETAAMHIRQMRENDRIWVTLGRAARATVMDRFTIAHTARRLLEIHAEWALPGPRSQAKLNSIEVAS